LRAKTVRFFSGKNGKIGNCDKGEKKQKDVQKKKRIVLKKKRIGKKVNVHQGYSSG
jgi:hypothetical protein